MHIGIQFTREGGRVQATRTPKPCTAFSAIMQFLPYIFDFVRGFAPQLTAKIAILKAYGSNS